MTRTKALFFTFVFSFLNIFSQKALARIWNLEELESQLKRFQVSQETIDQYQCATSTLLRWLGLCSNLPTNSNKKLVGIQILLERSIYLAKDWEETLQMDWKKTFRPEGRELVPFLEVFFELIDSLIEEHRRRELSGENTEKLTPFVDAAISIHIPLENYFVERSENIFRILEPYSLGESLPYSSFNFVKIVRESYSNNTIKPITSTAVYWSILNSLLGLEYLQEVIQSILGNYYLRDLSLKIVVNSCNRLNPMSGYLNMIISESLEACTRYNVLTSYLDIFFLNVKKLLQPKFQTIINNDGDVSLQEVTKDTKYVIFFNPTYTFLNFLSRASQEHIAEFGYPISNHNLKYIYTIIPLNLKTREVEKDFIHFSFKEDPYEFRKMTLNDFGTFLFQLEDSG